MNVLEFEALNVVRTLATILVTLTGCLSVQTRKTKKKTKKRVELAEDSDEVRGGEARKGACGGDSAGKARASLTLLKDLKKIQTTLRQDDVSWDD